MDKVKVKILKPVGPYSAGQDVEVDEETAAHLCDGVKAMRADDYEKMDAAKKDPKNLTVKEMHDLGVKNVPEDQITLQKTEKAAQAGRPVAAGEPITVTGGVTPPSLVFPAMAKAGGHAVTDVKEVKPEGKKDDKKSEVKPVEKK